MDDPWPVGTQAQALEVAQSIGRRLVDEAFWYGECCSWLGAEPIDHRHNPGGNSFRPLERWLYDGTSGVAVFLALLHRIVGGANLRRTALGAAAHAIERAAEAPPPDRLGLYSGWSGVALAGMLTGQALGADALVDTSHQLAFDTLVAHAAQGREFDIIGGHSGDLIAALCLYRSCGDTRLLGAAEALGQKLVETACRDGAMAWWQPSSGSENRGLLGFSHGTAGAALALLELWQHTAEPSLQATALAALAYERRWFNATVGNWPDLRGMTMRSRRPPKVYSVFWCHGAPGIALSRMRASQLLGDGESAQEARLALATTRRETAEYLRNGRGNFSLCHGLGGLGDILLLARQFGFGDKEDVTQIASIVSKAHRNHVCESSPWSCGTHSAETAGALLELAGIGTFHLRIAHPALPSLLMLSS